MGTLGAVELGGTKVLAAAGTLAELEDHLQINTGEPEPTIDAVCEFLRALGVSSVGVATFGPVELRPGHSRYGQITTTPKIPWQNFDLLDAVASRSGVPVAIDTDVNGAALGEYQWGALAGTGVGVYITVGTGIGGSVIVDGNPAGGISHPEMGHLVVNRHPDDDYPGGCPYHGTCLEGMASGPSIQARFGAEGSDLSGSDLVRALDLVSFYLGQGLRDLVYTVAPDRIVIGGGVSKLDGFHEAVRGQLSEWLAGYPGLEEPDVAGYVSAPALGDLSGLAGGLILAERASAQDL